MRSMLRVLLYGLLSLMLTFFLGCSGGKPVVQNTPVPTASASSEADATQSDKIKFKRDDGTEVFSLEFRSDGAKLEGGNGNELARFTIDDAQKVKVKNASDTALAYIVSDADKWKVENANQTKELYILRHQSDGDYKFETGSNQEIYRVKQRKYGFKVETPNKVSLYKVKLKKGKLSLRDASNKTVLYTKDALPAIALVPFGFKELTPEQQAGLAYALYRAGS